MPYITVGDLRAIITVLDGLSSIFIIADPKWQAALDRLRRCTL
jgi:hypothetical protein